VKFCRYLINYIWSSLNICIKQNSQDYILNILSMPLKFCVKDEILLDLESFLVDLEIMSELEQGWGVLGNLVLNKPWVKGTVNVLLVNVRFTKYPLKLLSELERWSYILKLIILNWSSQKMSFRVYAIRYKK